MPKLSCQMLSYPDWCATLCTVMYCPNLHDSPSQKNERLGPTRISCFFPKDKLKTSNYSKRYQELIYDLLMSLPVLRKIKNLSQSKKKYFLSHFENFSIFTQFQKCVEQFLNVIFYATSSIHALFVNFTFQIKTF